MKGAWRSLEAIAELGWSPDREDSFAAEPITAALVDQNLDLLTAVTSRVAAEDVAAALRLLEAAVADVDPRSETGIRLRLQRGVLAAAQGAFDVARTELEDTYIDAGRSGSHLSAEIRANLAVLSLLAGDLRTAGRRLVEAAELDDRAPDVLMASVRSALARLGSDHAAAASALRAQRQVVRRYIARVGTSAPTALTAGAAVAVNEFRDALVSGRQTEAAEILEGLELTAQRISAALGTRHPQALATRLNHATAEFSLARASKVAGQVKYALSALRTVTTNLVMALGTSHPQSLTASCNLAAADFELARMEKAILPAVGAFRVMRSCVSTMTEVLGDRHPHSIAASANLATAAFDLAVTEHPQVRLEDALELLQKAYLRADEVLGAEHNTTRVIRHQVDLCQQLLFGSEEVDSGTGTLLTRQQTAASTLSTPFGQDYMSFDQAGEVLRHRRPRTAVATKVVPPYFSSMSDEELLTWYAELQARAMNPQPGDVDFDHSHQAAKPMSVEELRHRIMTFDGWPGGISTLAAGSPFHNLWHWLQE